MLELLLIWQLAKDIGRVAARKGRSPGAYKMLLVGMFLIGEVAGAAAGALTVSNAAAVYLCAMLGAVCGAVGAFVIVRSVAPLTPTTHTRGFPILQPIGNGSVAKYPIDEI